MVRQRDGATAEFLVFVAKAKEVVTWAEADNIRLGPGNVQRELVESRWRQIKKFFAANANNVIPTSVTIALDDTVERVAQRCDLLRAGDQLVGMAGCLLGGQAARLARARRVAHCLEPQARHREQPADHVTMLALIHEEPLSWPRSRERGGKSRCSFRGRPT